MNNIYMSDQKMVYQLSANKFKIPESIYTCPGIQIGTQKVQSVLLSTDLTFIENLNMDSVMIMNLFEKSNTIDRAVIEFSRSPVFCDIGGGLLWEETTIKSAVGAFEAGAAGVVISKPTSPEIINRIREEIEGKLIYTVIFNKEPVDELADAGVDIINVSTGESTAETVFMIRELFPEIPIMANGGPYDSTIFHTIEMGADAIVFNPPTATEILRSVFDGYRNGTL